MAETLYFSIPEPETGQPIPYYVVWYQSEDALTWPDPYVDIVAIDTLPIDPDSGKYIWATNITDPYMYHMIKTRTIDGIESLDGITFPPNSLPQTKYSTVKIGDGAQTPYFIGSTIELMLNVDTDDALEIGDTIDVHVVDIFNNIIDEVFAEKIGDNLYATEFKIPIDLKNKYNINHLEEPDTNYYYLKDTWIFPNNTSVEFSFKVSRILEQPTDNNGIINVSIGSLLADNDTELSETSLSFTTKLDPFYATVDDVIAVSSTALKSTNALSIARQIMLVSNHVDRHMRPNYISDQEAYSSAVNCFVRLKSATNLLSEDLKLSGETKQLDTLVISKQYSSDRMIQELEYKADRCALIIYAGGKDTPFNNKLFVKGINDPNRPQVGRGRFDEYTNSPYLNYTSQPIIIIDSDGNSIEYRGIRTIGVKI
jgi:hypothetical protein